MNIDVGVAVAQNECVRKVNCTFISSQFCFNVVKIKLSN